MPSLDTHPFWYVYGFLLVVVFCRAQATYWLARWATQAVARTGRRAGALPDGQEKDTEPAEHMSGRLNRLAARLDGPGMDRARRFVDRWGAPAISISFLTIGFQTMVNAAAGVIRMNYLRYTIAMVVGSLAWALIYTTIGMAAFFGAVRLIAFSPWAAAALGLATVATVAVVLYRRRASKSKSPAVRSQCDAETQN